MIVWSLLVYLHFKLKKKRPNHVKYLCSVCFFLFIQSVFFLTLSLSLSLSLSFFLSLLLYHFQRFCFRLIIRHITFTLFYLFSMYFCSPFHFHGNDNSNNSGQCQVQITIDRDDPNDGNKTKYKTNKKSFSEWTFNISKIITANN